ncbi:nuclease [Micractinium conductrix]|uniref:Nuclease n=1 Tax=Micractinium conductrix TaxID=554055 RepID=A0A2P6V0P7_9CHLO|nr:nuclease [Micractinium conductrix]|eukprot:PSC67667.1 nuclease [Micractinium conductrix]
MPLMVAPQQRRRPTLVAAAAQPTGAAAPPPPPPPPLAAAALGCLAALLLTLAPPAVGAKELVQGYPRVVDGDTLDFSGTRVRLFGIDAPETKQSCTAKGGEYLCGERSKQALAAKIGKSKVECEQKNRDMYGRIVGVCLLPGGLGRQPEDLNAWLVEQGLAVAYRQYSKAYVPLEEAAREARRGIWSGSFELPQKWRQDNPRGGGGGAKAAAAVVAAPAPLAAPAAAVAALPAAVAQPPAGCAIKGNITAKGERIYHVPGGSFYDRTVIELNKGERFFCTAVEAEAAGWRASRS